MGSRYVRELNAGRRALQEHSATRHVTVSEEFLREDQSIAEYGEQDVNIFSGRHASQQHHFTVGPDPAGERHGISLQWYAIPWLVHVDRHFRKRLQILERDHQLGGAEPVAGRDDLDAGVSLGRVCKGARVGQLSPEVESAQEAEHLAEGGARFAADPLSQSEPGPSIQEKRGAFSRGTRW